MSEREYSDRDGAKWGAAREKGPLRYLLVRGVLARGVPLGALAFLWEYFVRQRKFETHELVLGGFVWLMVGILLAAFEWRDAERRHRKSD